MTFCAILRQDMLGWTRSTKTAPGAAACNLTHKHKSIQDPNQVLWPSLVPSSPKALFAFPIDKNESKGPLRKASTPLSHYKTE
jgi:hypothetical protein